MELSTFQAGWPWVVGSNAKSQNSTAGNEGVFDPANSPGAHFSLTHGSDSQVQPVGLLWRRAIALIDRPTEGFQCHRY
jgi:hypothetical protein